MAQNLIHCRLARCESNAAKTQVFMLISAEICRRPKQGKLQGAGGRQIGRVFFSGSVADSGICYCNTLKQHAAGADYANRF